MNMAVNGIDFDFGKHPPSFVSDVHPELRANYVTANPPFNVKESWDSKPEGDPRWENCDPPKGNADFGWQQHMLYHLAAEGSMALLPADGSMSSNAKGEGGIRETIVKADLVERMVVLPGQVFTKTQTASGSRPKRSIMEAEQPPTSATGRANSSTTPAGWPTRWTESSVP